MDIKAKEKLIKKCFNFFGEFSSDIKTKFKNVCNKTGRYNVPTNLWQKRTNRDTRVLISWKDVKNNKLTLKQLETFEGVSL